MHWLDCGAVLWSSPLCCSTAHCSTSSTSYVLSLLQTTRSTHTGPSPPLHPATEQLDILVDILKSDSWCENMFQYKKMFTWYAMCVKVEQTNYLCPCLICDFPTSVNDLWFHAPWTWAPCPLPSRLSARYRQWVLVWKTTLSQRIMWLGRKGTVLH